MNSSRTALVRQLLGEQQDTAVEQFARSHDTLPATTERYRALIPLTAPVAGQQYGFEVDLDACTGCKACVTGCHSLNGLDDGERWRTVGLLQGGTIDSPVLKTVTTACHHCVEPACMIGCPVGAYEKDPLTGIVKHLDDQCIGCQYCIFLCPYDAPKYNPARGIVRKCDLCSDRLAHAEAPACVQACPNEAIRVGLIDQAQAIEASSFLPGAPPPDLTLPTTVYRTRGELPHNLLPADFPTVLPEHSHPPLAVMLVLTQLAAGAFVVEKVLGGATALAGWMALALGMAALLASLWHLGRPRYAFRALLGIRTSWLSREILCFSLFVGLAAAYAASTRFGVADALRAPLLTLAAASGVIGVFASVMVYEATRRPSWRAWSVAPLFLASAGVTGCATLFTAAACAGAFKPVLAHAWIVIAASKLALEANALRHLRSRRSTALKQRAILLVHNLGKLTRWRFVCGVVGGIGLPALACALGGGAAVICALGGFLLTLAGELLERHLFFAAAPAPRMPGVPA
jgi:Fe-S-cluster-containing dehydrogenase component/DMSO reductase anchor subunit